MQCLFYVTVHKRLANRRSVQMHFCFYASCQFTLLNLLPFLSSVTFFGWFIPTSFIHSIFCLTTGPKPPPTRFLHIVRSRASSFKWEHPLLSLRSSSSFFRLLPRLLVTSISPFIFPSITCFRKQFLRKMWPIQLAFRFLISCRIFLCSLIFPII